MLRKSPQFRASDFFYALDLNNITHRIMPESNVIFFNIPAVWFKKKKGMLTVTQGSISDASNINRDFGGNRNPSLDEILNYLYTNFDGRYGGNGSYQWNGESMWAPQTTLQEQMEVQPKLQTYLDNHPAVPDGYEGWFSIK